MNYSIQELIEFLEHVQREYGNDSNVVVKTYTDDQTQAGYLTGIGKAKDGTVFLESTTARSIERPQSDIAKWEDCSNGWMCSACLRTSTVDYCKCPYCGKTMANGTIEQE